MKVVVLVVSVLVASVLSIGDDMIGLVIGGFGGSNSVDVITKGRVCSGSVSSPNIAGAPGGEIFGWSAALLSSGTKDEIFLCGGKITDESRSCHTLALGGSSWKEERCQLPSQRYYAAMFSNTGGQVVVAGGYSGRAGWLRDLDVLNSLNPSCDKDCCDWDASVATIPGRGVYAHCALEYDDDTMFIIGGNTWDSEVGQYDIPDVWKFTYSTKTWTQVQSLSIPRQSMGCIKTTYNGKEGIMVAGGYCHNNPEASCQQLRLSSTVFYDVAADTWIDLPDLNEEREGLALMNIQGTVMAVGGSIRGELLDIVETWDGEKWSVSNMHLSSKRRSFAYVHVPQSAYTCP